MASIVPGGSTYEASRSSMLANLDPAAPGRVLLLFLEMANRPTGDG